MKLAVLAKQTEKILLDNSPALLTAIGVVGTVTTAYLTGTASIKADRILREDHDRRLQDANGISAELLPATPKEKVELTWKLFVPPVGSGLLTISAIIS